MMDFSKFIVIPVVSRLFKFRPGQVDLQFFVKAFPKMYVVRRQNVIKVHGIQYKYPENFHVSTDKITLILTAGFIA